MATMITSLKRPPYRYAWEWAFMTIGTFVCIGWPAGTLIHARVFQGVWLDDPWRWILLGIGSLLFAICEYLSSIHGCLQAPLDLMYLVLKNPDSDERAISLATIHHLRRLLRMPDGEN